MAGRFLGLLVGTTSVSATGYTEAEKAAFCHDAANWNGTATHETDSSTITCDALAIEILDDPLVFDLKTVCHSPHPYYSTNHTANFPATCCNDQQTSCKQHAETIDTVAACLPRYREFPCACRNRWQACLSRQTKNSCEAIVGENSPQAATCCKWFEHDRQGTEPTLTDLVANPALLTNMTAPKAWKNDVGGGGYDPDNDVLADAHLDWLAADSTNCLCLEPGHPSGHDPRYKPLDNPPVCPAITCDAQTGACICPEDD